MCGGTTHLGRATSRFASRGQGALHSRGSPPQDAVLVVGVSLSVNLSSLTIEQVIGKRKKMLVDMLPGLRGELRVEQ